VPSDHAEPPFRLGQADLGRVRVLGHLVGGPPRIGARWPSPRSPSARPRDTAGRAWSTPSRSRGI